MKRQEIIDKQLEYEREGKFNDELFGEDWSDCVPVTEKYPYIRKGFFTRLSIALKRLFIINPFMRKQNKVLHTQVDGKEHLKGIKSGIVTTNHINIFDSIAVKKALMPKRTKYVVAEFNIKNNFVFKMMQAEGILPVSKNHLAMKKFDEAIGYYLKHGQFVAICAEQSMWDMYQKPRPYKIGAFHYAVKYDVPIIPIFITFRPSGQFDEDGFEKQYFTVNILPPLYANKDLDPKAQMLDLKERNEQACKETYEKVYGKPLVYETK